MLSFITAFTMARHLSLSWASSILSIPPHPTSWRPILILSSHLRLGLPSDLFPSGFPTNTLYTHLLSPIRATCPAHRILLDCITRTILGKQYSSMICHHIKFVLHWRKRSICILCSHTSLGGVKLELRYGHIDEGMKNNFHQVSPLP